MKLRKRKFFTKFYIFFGNYKNIMGYSHPFKLDVVNDDDKYVFFLNI